MPNTWKNRVGFVAAAAGTSDFAIASALPGLRTPGDAGYGDGQTAGYIAFNIADASQWELGQGTYDATGPTWRRTLIRQSSNGGSPVNFGSVPYIKIEPLAEDLLFVHHLAPVIHALYGGI